jgi:hypothetical protein
MKLFSALFILMLVAQFLVPLVPTWGEFVPHDHWVRLPFGGRISPEEWQAHLQEHREGGSSQQPLVHSAPGEAKIVSTLSHDGLTTLYAPLALTESQRAVIPPMYAFVHLLMTHTHDARALSYPPPVPPPVV